MAEKTAVPSPASPFAGYGTELLERLRTVQVMANDRDEIPERHLNKESQREGSQNTDDIPLMDFPVIDLNRMLTPSAEEELQKLQSALEAWGCFQVINHGIEFSLLEKLKNNGKEFFKLPNEEKQKYSRGENDIEGYGSDQILTWTERVYLNAKPEDNRKLQYWPQNPKSFREVLEEYTRRTEDLIETLLKCMAKSLDLADDSFLKQCGERHGLLALHNFYPPCPNPDVILGQNPHADASTITVLLPDQEVEGLQFQRDDQWFRVRTDPGALLVNVGDQIEIMSNGIFKSPIHRVVANKEKERMTVAMFGTPGVGEEIGPVEELINEKRPRMYKTIKDYYPAFFFKYFLLGKRAIEGVKL